LNKLLALLLLAFLLPLQTSAKTQYIMVSFDGSKNLNMWSNLLFSADRFDAKFTFFISGVYFLADKNKNLYTPPGFPRGTSHIGFGGTANDVKQRMDYVKTAIMNGHEISSHANGHFEGGLTEWKGKTVGHNWSFDMWSHELESFFNFLWFSAKNNNLRLPSEEIKDWHYLLTGQITGFRAPNLSVNKSLEKALSKAYIADTQIQFYAYDSSSSRNITKAQKNKYQIWDLPLGYIDIVGTNKRTIAMDFNFYNHDSGAKPDPKNSKIYEERYYKSLKKYFAFISETCRRKGVECITMAKYANILTRQEHKSRVKLQAQINSEAYKQGIGIKVPNPKSRPLSCNAEAHLEQVDEESLVLDF